jgi:hypothetical protein
MLMLLLSLATYAFAANDSCSLSEVLKSARPEKKCVEAFLAKIPNAEDRSEVKYRLSQWEPIKDLKVISSDGMIEAFIGEKFYMRTILLQKQKPMLIYMDGKILVDNSDNPSFARRLENAMKQNNSAATHFFLPEAQAQTISKANLQQTLTLLYSLDEVASLSDVNTIVKDSEKIQAFLPARHWLAKKLVGVAQVRCTSTDLVEGTEFRQRESSYGTDPVLKVTPKSQTEFIVTGIQRGKIHLIRMSSWDATGPNGRLQPTLALKSAGHQATLSTCSDAECKTLEDTSLLENWNPISSKSPREKSRVTENNRQTMIHLNSKFREELIGKLFGLSVMGSCCTSPKCRESMLQRFNVQLHPTAPGQPAVTR